MLNTIQDISLAEQGEKKIKWVERYMPICRKLGDRFELEQPFKDLKIALSIHLEAKTAYLCRILARGGATMFVTGSNPLSTQDDVAAALASWGQNGNNSLVVHAVHGCSDAEYLDNLRQVLKPGPSIIIDDGGDLVSLMHQEFRELLPQVIGACEETTTGILRLKQMEKTNSLCFPAIAVNNADCKHLFDNRYGTGQSVFDGIMRTTNLQISSKNVVVAGYGWCGKGIAMRARGLGANVIVAEIDPVKALEANMDGFRVMTMLKAAEIGDIFITATGNRDVISARHFSVMKDGAILCNAGHFDVEIAMEKLRRCATRSYKAKTNITNYQLADHTISVLAEGRLVNLASGDGHPAEIMDMSFAIQALSIAYLVRRGQKLTPGVHVVPETIDKKVAQICLRERGVSIDTLTKEQKEYYFV